MNSQIHYKNMKTHLNTNHPGRTRLAKIPFLALLLLTLGAQVHAGDLDIRLTAQRVLAKPDGQELLQPADRAFPGDIVQYDAVYQNRGPRAISNLQPTLPIPAGMEYLPDSAKPAPAQASLDGRRFEPIPLKRRVTLASGEVREEEIPPSDYRALRWSAGDLSAAGKTTIVVRARVAPVTPRPGLAKN